MSVGHLTNGRGILTAAISPDGRHLATIEHIGANRGIFLMDTATGVRRVIGQGAVYLTPHRQVVRRIPDAIAWVMNDLIAVDYGAEAVSIDLAGDTVANIGSEILEKAEPGNPASPVLLVYAEEPKQGFSIVNARTGKMTTFDLPAPGKVVNWALSAKGELRALALEISSAGPDHGRVSNWYKPAAQGPWTMLAEFGAAHERWQPLEAQEEDKLLVLTRIGRDTRAILSYDVKTRTLGELVAGHPTQDIVDVNGRISEGTGSIVVEGMKRERTWLDARWHAAQQAVDAALPGRVNTLSGDPAKMILVSSYSDTDPGSWYLVNMEKASVGLLGHSRQALEGVEMRPKEILAYKARDGLSIPAFLTRAAGKPGPQPLVVMVHDGPAQHDSWQWHPKVQMLAAQGYAVFQPQFRGSSGFGRKFLMAGGEWGLSMQDDVTDGVRYLISQGIADPQRICIYGERYGGYAALWGLVQTPELYRCGISDNGVFDLLPAFNSVSPLIHAAAIRAPVLLMHDAADLGVPIAHSRKMRAALAEAGKPSEWEEFETGAPGTYRSDDDHRYYARLLGFLRKHLGPAPAVEAEPAAGAGEQ